MKILSSALRVDGTQTTPTPGVGSRTEQVATTEFVQVAVESHPTLELGENSITAHRGDHGVAAYNHSQAAHAPSNAQKNSDITKSEIEAKLTGTITTHAHFNQTLDTTSNVMFNRLELPNPLSQTFSMSSTNNVAISPSVTDMANLPISLLQWHDHAAFLKASVPTFETSADGDVWVESPVDRDLFSQKKDIRKTVLTDNGYARWTWNNSNIRYSSIRWIAIAHTYQWPQPVKIVTIEVGDDGVNWTTVHTSTYNTVQKTIYHFMSASPANQSYLRLTIQKTDGSLMSLAAIKLLTDRWGDQGRGSEHQYPYTWDNVGNMTANGSIGGNSIFVSGVRKDTVWDAKSNLALGTTSTTAYRGDHGLIAYNHSQAAHAPSDANNYVHPVNHPPSIITQDASNRFVTDVEKINWGNKSEIPYVVGTQTITTAAWTGEIPTLDALYDGLSIRYWLPNTSGSNVTLNLTLKDGSTTGEIPCYYGGTTRLTTHYPAGSFIMLTYIENQRIGGTLYTGWWAKANYVDGTESYTVRWNSTLQAGAEITQYKLCMQALDGKMYPLSIGNTTANTKTPSGVEFLVNSPILIYQSTTTLAANGTNASAWHEGIGTTVLQYTLNQSSGFVAYKPVYIRGTATMNGTFVLDNTTLTSWFTQDLPTTDDGFIYILLAIMTNTTTSFRLPVSHPMYEYKDGALRQYVAVHNHTALSITQDASNRFVTDVEKSTWNAKSNLALGTTSTTAYRGDHGLVAYNHSQTAHAPSDANNYVHPTGAGNNHMPTGGTVGQVLKNTASGTATWQNEYSYTHPANHPPSIITQDASNRFVTDAEKTTWNAKSNLALGTTSTTAYRGDHGLVAYNHSQSAHQPVLVSGTNIKTINEESILGAGNLTVSGGYRTQLHQQRTQLGSTPVSTINIPFAGYNAAEDSLLVFADGALLALSTDYTISGTTITLATSWKEVEFLLVLLKNITGQYSENFDGNLLNPFSTPQISLEAHSIKRSNKQYGLFRTVKYFNRAGVLIKQTELTDYLGGVFTKRTDIYGSDSGTGTIAPWAVINYDLVWDVDGDLAEENIVSGYYDENGPLSGRVW